MPRLASRLLHLWFRLSRGLTLGVRAAVLDGRGRVLLVRHTYVGGWHLPGGGVEAGEAALDALSRELAEEAAVALRGPPRLHGIFFDGAVARRDHVLVYAVRDFVELGPKRPDAEIAAAEFFPLDALPPGTTAATRAWLDEIGPDGRSGPV